VSEISTLSEFIERYGIVAEAVRQTSNPNMVDDSTDPGRRHWLVTLHLPDGFFCAIDSLDIPFTQGSAHTKDPTAADVLECLASDMSSAGQPFGDWCADLGYDEDSRKAYATWQAVESQAAAVRDWLGEALTDELLAVDTDA
jgi:hypothetical protein